MAAIPRSAMSMRGRTVSNAPVSTAHLTTPNPQQTPIGKRWGGSSNKILSKAKGRIPCPSRGGGIGGGIHFQTKTGGRLSLPKQERMRREKVAALGGTATITVRKADINQYGLNAAQQARAAKGQKQVMLINRQIAVLQSRADNSSTPGDKEHYAERIKALRERLKTVALGSYATNVDIGQYNMMRGRAGGAGIPPSIIPTQTTNETPIQPSPTSIIDEDEDEDEDENGNPWDLNTFDDFTTDDEDDDQGSADMVDAGGFYSPGDQFDASPITGAPPAPPLLNEDQLWEEQVKRDRETYGTPPYFDIPWHYDRYGESEGGELQLHAARTGFYYPSDKDDLELAKRLGPASEIHGSLSFGIGRGGFGGELPKIPFQFGDDPEPKGKEKEEVPPGITIEDVLETIDEPDSLKKVEKVINNPVVNRIAENEVKREIKKEEEERVSSGVKRRRGEEAGGSLKKARTAVGDVVNASPNTSKAEMDKKMNEAEKRWLEYVKKTYPEKSGERKKMVSLDTLILASPAKLSGETFTSLPKDQPLARKDAKRARIEISQPKGASAKKIRALNPDEEEPLYDEASETLSKIRALNAARFQKRMLEKHPELANIGSEQWTANEGNQLPKFQIEERKKGRWKPTENFSYPSPNSQTYLAIEMAKKGIDPLEARRN